MYNMQVTIPIVNYKIDLEILILIAVIYLIMSIHTVCGCCSFYKRMEGMDNKKKVVIKKEGFSGANTNYGQSSPYDITKDTPINTANWMQPNLTVTPGQPIDAGVKAILDRPEQPVPLPEGEMLMFANTPFKPECCGPGGSSFSTSDGCACMTTQQYNFLIQRGFNNVPYSEY